MLNPTYDSMQPYQGLTLFAVGTAAWYVAYKNIQLDAFGVFSLAYTLL